MRSYKIGTALLESIVDKQGLTPEQLAEINNLQAKVVNLDKKTSAFKLINERIGQILCAFKARACMIVLVNVTKRLHKLLSTMPTSTATYEQLIKLVEGLHKSCVQAQANAPVAQPSFKVDLGLPLKFKSEVQEEGVA